MSEAKKINGKAIALGVVLELVLSILGQVVGGIIFGATAADVRDLEKKLEEPRAWIPIFALGALGAVFAGYITGLVAKHAETKHGVVLGVFCLVLSALLIFGTLPPENPRPSMPQLLALVFTIPACALGGLAAEQRRLA